MNGLSEKIWYQHKTFTVAYTNEVFNIKTPSYYKYCTGVIINTEPNSIGSETLLAFKYNGLYVYNLMPAFFYFGTSRLILNKNINPINIKASGNYIEVEVQKATVGKIVSLTFVYTNEPNKFIPFKVDYKKIEIPAFTASINDILKLEHNFNKIIGFSLFNTAVISVNFLFSLREENLYHLKDLSYRILSHKIQEPVNEKMINPFIKEVDRFDIEITNASNPDQYNTYIFLKLNQNNDIPSFTELSKK